ncbi:MAG TPA: helix-turn-helix domain-containing protein [Polyangiaceae bacterium]|nr:helix-turn-helix domain-containing protein [Polyangiaceae bacterium]
MAPEPKIRSRIREGFPGQRLVVLPPRAVERAGELPVCRSLYATHIGRFDAARHHFVARRQGTNDYVFIACLAGAGRCWIRQRAWTLEEGHAIVLPPGVHHRYRADETDPWTIFWIHFSGRSARDYCRAMNVSGDHPRFWISDMPRIAAAFEEVYSYVLGGYTDLDLLGLSTSMARLFGLCRYWQRSPSLRRRETEERVLAAIRLMHEHVGRPLRLEECARRTGWSASHFSMVFKRQVNIAPMEFFARLKTMRACELLKTTNLSIEEIAHELGFDDAFYFSRFFKKHHRLSPSRYRQKFSLS